jgi:hypothetical protein
VQSGQEIDEVDANFNDLLVAIVALAALATFLGTVITFLRWFRRAYFNLHQRVRHLEFKEEWAVGAWFVPIINLGRPFKIMKELYVETRDLLKKNEIAMPYTISTATLGWWWAAWIIMGIADNISFRMSLKDETLIQLINGTQADMIANLIGIPAALLAIKVIGDYDRVEGLLMDVKEEEYQQLTPNSGVTR